MIIGNEIKIAKRSKLLFQILWLARFVFKGAGVKRLVGQNFYKQRFTIQWLDLFHD